MSFHDLQKISDAILIMFMELVAKFHFSFVSLVEVLVSIIDLLVCVVDNYEVSFLVEGGDKIEKTML